MQNARSRPLGSCLAVAFLACIFTAQVCSADQRIPTNWEVTNEIHRDLDNLCRKTERYFKANGDSIIRGIQATNNAERAIIAPLYKQVFNIDIPPGAPEDAPQGELASLTDGQLYPDAWRELIADAPVASSDYLNKRIAGFLASPTTNPDSVARIQSAAANEWQRYQPLAADNFSHDAVQITTDFQTRLAAVAREHRDLREALAAIAGPIPVENFETDFQKYVLAAQAKIPPPAAAPASAPAPAAPQPAPAASPAPATTPPNQAPEQTAAELVEPLKTALDDLSTKLDAQKQAVSAVKLKAQTLDDDYPLLHRELSEQIEKLTGDIFWFRLVLVAAVLGALLAIFVSVTAINRTVPANSRKSNSQGNGRKKPDSQAPREEPMKLILERIYKLEQEISRLEEKLVHEEISDPAASVTPDRPKQ